MLKLLLVDDEEIIRNTIASSVDWESYGISLIGTCPDGVEAYHTILDEIPDIVMTDIRMPGISGLELVERIAKTDLNVHFIILSGYGEFEYAKRAMKCGVKHYLLKPCDTTQIEDCLKEVATECRNDHWQSNAPSNSMFGQLRQTLLRNIISDGCSLDELTPAFYDRFEQYLDLHDTPYQVCYIYYLEQNNLDIALVQINRFLTNIAPDLEVGKLYVRNTLIFYFPNFDPDYKAFDSFFKSLSISGQSVETEYQRVSFPDLQSVLDTIIQKLRRYDMFWFLTKEGMKENFNYGKITMQCSHMIAALLRASAEKRPAIIADFTELLGSITNVHFLLQLTDTALIQITSSLNGESMDNIVSFLLSLHKLEDAPGIIKVFTEKLKEVLGAAPALENSYSPFIEKTIAYLNTHLSNPDLTLKWISENYLYMNVNYVSRCFYKETGEKFSTYLMNLRIEKAKQIFMETPDIPIHEVAEQVGCGNNPYYFNRIFKKGTGMSPSMCVKRLHAR